MVTFHPARVSRRLVFAAARAAVGLLALGVHTAGDSVG